MKRAIIDFEIEGVKNTLEFGRFVMNNQHFFDGEFDTGFIAREMDKFLGINDDITESMIAALVSYKFVNKFDPIKIADRPASRNMWRERRK